MFIETKIYNKLIGILYFEQKTKSVLFEYDKKFLASNLNIAPILMPLSQKNKVYSFDNLEEETFKNLPPIFADSLPDKFGSTILNKWLSIKGKSIDDLNPLERLSYIGERGMGALEYFPNQSLKSKGNPIEITEIVEIAKRVLSNKKQIRSSNSLENILQIGTSAGGARAKAIIAINQKTNEVISGDIISTDENYKYYILKIDGIIDEQTGLPKGYGKIEYAYYKMAKLAKINMANSELYLENNNAHFMTERFDRINSEKIHMQTLCGIASMDYNNPLQHSYEQCFGVMQKLNLPHTDFIKQYRRMVFNVLAKNCDDHTKNISFLMDQKGEWSLSPAYDITFAYNPTNYWINQHQMSVNGKRKDITIQDLEAVGKAYEIRNRKTIIKEVKDAISHWREIAEEIKIEEQRIKWIESNLIM